MGENHFSYLYGQSFKLDNPKPICIGILCRLSLPVICEKGIHNMEIVYFHDLINRIWTNVFTSFEYASRLPKEFILIQSGPDQWPTRRKLYSDSFPKGQINSM